MTALAANVLAISWEPELRGILIFIISVTLFCGSIYLVLATNLGARLGFLVALTGLAGWMTLLGIIWMIYGIGLKGPDPSWAEVPGRTVLQDTDALYQAEVFEQRVEVPEDATLLRGSRDRRRRVRRRGVGVAERGRPGVRAGGGRGRRVPRGDRNVRRRRVPGRAGLRHRWRALPDDRELRPLRVLPQAALRGGRGGPARPDPHRGRSRPAAARDRRHPPAPVRLHDPRPRRAAAAGSGAHSRVGPHLPHRLLAAASTRARARPPTAAPPLVPDGAEQ